MFKLGLFFWITGFFFLFSLRKQFFDKFVIKLWRNENFCRFSPPKTFSRTQAFTSFFEFSTALDRLLVGVATVLSEWTRFRCEKQFPELATAFKIKEKQIQLDAIWLICKQEPALEIQYQTYMIFHKRGIDMAWPLYADSYGISNPGRVWMFLCKYYICAVEHCCARSHAVWVYYWMDRRDHRCDTKTFHPHDIPYAVADWFAS